MKRVGGWKEVEAEGKIQVVGSEGKEEESPSRNTGKVDVHFCQTNEGS